MTPPLPSSPSLFPHRRSPLLTAQKTMPRQNNTLPASWAAKEGTAATHAFVWSPGGLFSSPLAAPIHQLLSTWERRKSPHGLQIGSGVCKSPRRRPPTPTNATRNRDSPPPIIRRVGRRTSGLRLGGVGGGSQAAVSRRHYCRCRRGCRRRRWRGRRGRRRHYCRCRRGRRRRRR